MTELGAPRTPETEALLSSAFKSFLVATVATSLVNGTTRLGFVWAMGELTSWKPAVGLLGIMLGVPFLLAAPVAGTLADRYDRRVVAAVASVAMAATSAVTGIALWQGGIGPIGLSIAGFIVSLPVAAVAPPLQAMVPSLVPAARLMNGIAFQNLAMLSAMAIGQLVGGFSIDAFGTPLMFGLTATFGLVAAALLMALPASVGTVGSVDTDGTAGTDGAPPASQARGLKALAEGVAYARRDPTAVTLIAVAAVLGIASAGAALLFPAFADDVLDAGARGAGALNAAMAMGLIVTATVLARRTSLARPARLLAIVFGGIAGPGMIAIANSPTLVWALLACLGWGMGGGVVMTLQRTLLQSRTAPEVMGRVMGLAAMAQFGTFPIGAIVVFVLVGRFGIVNTLTVMGVMVLVSALTLGTRLVHNDNQESARSAVH